MEVGVCISYNLQILRISANAKFELVSVITCRPSGACGRTRLVFLHTCRAAGAFDVWQESYVGNRKGFLSLSSNTRSKPVAERKTSVNL